MARFILEIGTEEIPARFLAGEEEDLVRLFDNALAEAGLRHGAIRAMATPRRLALLIDDLADREEEREEIITGPAVAAAYDQSGAPTQALLGFAKSHNITPEQVFRQHTPKGEYVAARIKSGGRSAREALAGICPRAIGSLAFPKSMRWGSNELSYGRPLRWILALLDDEVIDFEVGPVHSGRNTWGHRLHGTGPFEVGSAAGYEDVIAEKCAVTLDPARRREMITAKGASLAAEQGGNVIWKDNLLDEVCGLVEHPVPMIGDFDPSYLEIPEEVLLTSMETHQKSFGLSGSDGKLLPHFLTVLNMEPRDSALVKAGWERVLRARLEDARFFWRSDIATSFDEWLKKLESVIFIGPLGTMAEKSKRLEELTQWLAWRLAPGEVEPAIAKRAGELAKADLVSAMVGEFDTLQGIMGGIYAARAGEDTAVARALAEQYLPAGPDSPVPASVTGSLLAVADRADTLAGCFGLDMIPTGAADPNGLRRCALGIIRILLDRGWSLDVTELFTEARRLYGDQKWKLPAEEALARLMEFFKGRLRNYFIGLGYDTLLTDSALASGAANPVDALARLDAIAAFSKKDSFIKSAQMMKRVENIGKKAKTSDQAWDNGLIVEDAEKALASTLAGQLPAIDKMIAEGRYQEALERLEELHAPVDAFFDKVLVLCEDEKTRENRLRLLNALAARFNRIALFSGLQI